MLPSAQPDFLDLPVNHLTEPEGIKRAVEVRELVFRALRDVRRIQDALVGVFGASWTLRILERMRCLCLSLAEGRKKLWKSRHWVV